LKVLRLVPLALVLAACSSVNVPLSPYRIDVQQGNALEQESVEKLKLGLSRSQVRFLLGTPLLVDPFHGNRWDYVYNFRKAGKLTEERRLALLFEGDVLVRIEAEGLALNSGQPEVKPAETEKTLEKRTEQPKAAVETAPVAAVQPLENAQPLQLVAAPAAEPAAKPVGSPSKPAEPAVAQPATAPTANAKPAQPAPEPVSEAATRPVQAVAANSAPVEASGANSPEKTSIVPPLRADQAQPPQQGKPAMVAATAPEPVALQAEANVEAIKPDVMPEFPNATPADTPEGQLMAALNAWAEAWRTRNEEAYLAAYAASFRPEDGQTREQWEKRRRLLLGVSRNIDLQIDGVATESMKEERAQVSFRQFYRSDSYRDAVIKQLKFVRVDGQWLIEEEKVLAQIKGNK
jgi:Small protein A (tmRNA-binding)